MDRRDFVKAGAIGVAGLAAEGAGFLPWIEKAAAAAPKGQPWKFGVMADTQWLGMNGTLNPGACAVEIINKLNAEFIKHGVQFVIQVGDLVDVETDSYNGNPSARTLPTRAAAAKALYDAGIGFFPVRGNHEGSSIAANEFPGIFPQTRGMGPNVAGARDFNSPFASLAGLSYSFEFGDVRFVLVDQFTRTDGTNFRSNSNYNTIDQQPWIDTVLSSRPKGSHAFVFSHKNLIGQNHVDTLLGANPSVNVPSFADPTLGARDAFIHSLANNDVRYQIGGHDHMHHRALVTSPDGKASVRELICASNSYKFYTPANPSNDTAYDVLANGISGSRELVAAQELYTIGYYIFTVDGPRMTVDFYSATAGEDYGNCDVTASSETYLTSSPAGMAGTFFKRESWGYSLNGREFVIGEGASYSSVNDAFQGTMMRILGGKNGGTETDLARRQMVKTVNTGWTPADIQDDWAASHTLSIWGTADSLALWDTALTGLLPASPRTKHADTYALEMSYDHPQTRPIGLGNGSFGIATRDANGKWANAVDANFGGKKHFTVGPYHPSYGLGTYGVDPSTKTAWAVVDYDGDFAVRRGL